MNYYSEIKQELISNEINKNIKDYSKNKYELQKYYNVGKLLLEAGNQYGESIIKEYSLKGLLPKDDLLRSISCIPVDCKNIENCNCGDSSFGTPTLHFEIPQIITDFNGGIEYVGTIDKQNSFYWYTNPNSLKYHIVYHLKHQV